jgi:hypothetical protein
MSNTIATQVAVPTIEGACEAGRMFAKSEIDAQGSLEVYARTLGTDPTIDHWNQCRISWVNAYVSVKPQAKGNSADKAFARFKGRLTESYGIEAPKAKSEAAEKKAQERAKKAQELAQRFEAYSDADLTGMLQKAYADQAQNPMKKSSLLGELERAVKQRAKAQAEVNRDALKASRDRLFKLARECNDPIRIDAACDVLDELNFDIKIG